MDFRTLKPIAETGPPILYIHCTTRLDWGELNTPEAPGLVSGPSSRKWAAAASIQWLSVFPLVCQDRWTTLGFPKSEILVVSSGRDLSFPTLLQNAVEFSRAPLVGSEGNWSGYLPNSELGFATLYEKRSLKLFPPLSILLWWGCGPPCLFLQPQELLFPWSPFPHLIPTCLKYQLYS